MLDELHGPFVAHVVEEPSNVRVQHPVHLLPHGADPERIQRLMLASSGAESIREPLKILLINLIEDRYHRLLHDFVLQSSYAQRSQPSVGFRYIGSLRRLR